MMLRLPDSSLVRSVLGSALTFIAATGLVASLFVAPSPAFAESEGEETQEEPVDPAGPEEPLEGDEPIEGELESEIPPERLEAESEDEMLSDGHADALEGVIGQSEMRTFAAPSSGRSASGFKAGYIISDANFYNGNAMTASQVQTFLNQRVVNPTSKSLRNYSQSTPRKPVSSYCNGYSGKSSETAAQIIANVGKSCGISQRAILVTLQKEQSLVVNGSPSTTNYNRAMGYSCPDTGKDYAANCDPAHGGFFNQVWGGAHRLKEYRDILWTKHAGKTYALQWNKDPACGTSNVYIENWATAALYTYTPYIPNRSVLNSGGDYRKGDACASWGNYNFYTIYKQWFGSPNTFFPDVGNNHQFYKEIEWMGKSGLSTGTKQSNGGAPRYYPKDRVTREAMAAFLYRMSGSPSVNLPSSSPFADMRRGDKFYKEIIWMHQTGMSTGIAQSSGKPIYAPKDRVSREAVAAFMYRMSNANYRGPENSPFADMRRGDKFYNEIAWMHSSGLSTGIRQPSGKPNYAPKDRMSREAMAAFLYRSSN